MREAARGGGRRSRRVPTDGGVQVTSMMDMFTILLIYLLYFFDPSNDPARQVELPGSSAAAGEISGVVVTVGVDRLWIGEVEQGEDGLGAALEAELTRAERPGGEGARLVLKCDRRVPYQRVEEILTVASQVGYTEYRFVVLNEGAGSLNR